MDIVYHPLFFVGLLNLAIVITTATVCILTSNAVGLLALLLLQPMPILATQNSAGDEEDTLAEGEGEDYQESGMGFTATVK
jgi:hypothetical protein